MVALALIVVAFLAVPLSNNSYFLHLLTLMFAFAIMAESWNLMGGFTGYPDFGLVVFFGLGASTTGASCPRARRRSRARPCW